jgi:enoyl-CoA hydratase/carnithine racemase
MTTQHKGSDTVDKIDLEVSSKVAIITINHPERRNAVNEETAGELLEVFEAFD